MGDIIPFPIQKVKLNEDESKEYYELKEAIDKASTYREIRILSRRVKEFIMGVEERIRKEKKS